MVQVSRSSSLKIPKDLEINIKGANTIEDTLAVQKGIATAENQRWNEKERKEKET